MMLRNMFYDQNDPPSCKNICKRFLIFLKSLQNIILQRVLVILSRRCHSFLDGKSFESFLKVYDTVETYKKNVKIMKNFFYKSSSPRSIITKYTKILVLGLRSTSRPPKNEKFPVPCPFIFHSFIYKVEEFKE